MSRVEATSWQRFGGVRYRNILLHPVKWCRQQRLETNCPPTTTVFPPNFLDGCRVAVSFGRNLIAVVRDRSPEENYCNEQADGNILEPLCKHLKIFSADGALLASTPWPYTNLATFEWTAHTDQLVCVFKNLLVRVFSAEAALVTFFALAGGEGQYSGAEVTGQAKVLYAKVSSGIFLLVEDCDEISLLHNSSYTQRRLQRLAVLPRQDSRESGGTNKKTLGPAIGYDSSELLQPTAFACLPVRSTHQEQAMAAVRSVGSQGDEDHVLNEQTKKMVVLITTSNSKLILVGFDGTLVVSSLHELVCEIIVVSGTGKLVGLLSSRTRQLKIITASALRTALDTSDATIVQATADVTCPHQEALQVAWVGDDCLALQTALPMPSGAIQNTLLLGGPANEWLPIEMGGNVIILTEPDGLRVLDGVSCTLIQRVPSSVQDILGLGRFSPAAMLFFGWENQRGNSNLATSSSRSSRPWLTEGADHAETSLRALGVRKMAAAINVNLQAAESEYDLKNAMTYARCALFGMDFLDRMNNNCGGTANLDNERGIDNRLRYLALLRDLRVVYIMQSTLKVHTSVAAIRHDGLLPVVMRHADRRLHAESIAIGEWLGLFSTTERNSSLGTQVLAAILFDWAEKILTHPKNLKLTDAEIAQLLLSRLSQYPRAARMVLAAVVELLSSLKSPRTHLAAILLDYEPDPHRRVRTLIRLRAWEEAMNGALSTFSPSLLCELIQALQLEHRSGNQDHDVLRSALETAPSEVVRLFVSKSIGEGTLRETQRLVESAGRSLYAGLLAIHLTDCTLDHACRHRVKSRPASHSRPAVPEILSWLSRGAALLNSTVDAKGVSERHGLSSAVQRKFVEICVSSSELHSAQKELEEKSLMKGWHGAPIYFQGLTPAATLDKLVRLGQEGEAFAIASKSRWPQQLVLHVVHAAALDCPGRSVCKLFRGVPDVELLVAAAERRMLEPELLDHLSNCNEDVRARWIRCLNLDPTTLKKKGGAVEIARSWLSTMGFPSQQHQ